jgi:Rap1a immunity proteins
MTRSLAAILLTLTAIAIAVPARAQSLPETALAGDLVVADKAADVWAGNTLLEPCRALLDPANTRGNFSEGMCEGVIASISFWFSGNVFCAPAGATHQQLDRVIVRYMDQQPERLHEDFRGLAIEALIATWPCPKK